MSLLHPRTLATLDKLSRVEWFANAGVVDTESAEVLPDWQNAITSCLSLEWENICLEAANQYRMRIAERSSQAMARWNDVVDSVKPASTALVATKCAATVRQHDLPQEFLDTVDWDMLHLCMEAEFADVFPPGFFASQAYWYSVGHFPCGWHGPFPEGGRLIIY